MIVLSLKLCSLVREFERELYMSAFSPLGPDFFLPSHFGFACARTRLMRAAPALLCGRRAVVWSWWFSLGVATR